MDLLGVKVKHEDFGNGEVIEQTANVINVRFKEVQDGHISYSEHRFVFPDVSLFRLFLTADNPLIQKAILESTLSSYPFVSYKSVTYYRKFESYWIDINNVYVGDSLSHSIERAYQDKLKAEQVQKLYSSSIEDLLLIASSACDDLKKLKDNYNGAVGRLPDDGIMMALSRRAVVHFEVAFKKLDCDKSYDFDKRNSILRRYLPMLSAQYRNIGEPVCCVKKIYSKYKSYGTDVLSHEFFTSLAAAYCDMSDYDSAMDAIDVALCLNRSVLNSHMNNVVERINAHSAYNPSCVRVQA